MGLKYRLCTRTSILIKYFYNTITPKVNLKNKIFYSSDKIAFVPFHEKVEKLSI